MANDIDLEYNLTTMPSVEGLKTWFDYQLLISALVLLFFAILFVANTITGHLKDLFEGISFTSLEFALTFTATGIGAILLMIWLAGQYNDQ